VRMRISSTYEDALSAYRSVRAVKPRMFDGKAYTAILHAYCTLQLGEFAFPPSQGFFEIAKDMQDEGYPKTPQIYTILLGHYAKSAKQFRTMKDVGMRESLRRVLLETVRKTHNLISLDASLSPDVALWNQLMDTYNRVGSISDALEIWTVLRTSGQVNNTSVSIILDACAYARADVKAASIFSALKSSAFPLNLHNWNTWVECLCRLHRLDGALKVACVEMPQLDDRSCHPDESTVDILIKFAARAGKEREVRSLIEQYLPILWSTLPESVRNYRN